MGNVRLLALSLAAATLSIPGAALADTRAYTADNWPLAITERPLTLAPGMLELRGDTFRMSLSKGAVGEPISLAPDIYVGTSETITVGITHRIGVCLTPGEENNCPTAYHDVGAEALYSLMHGGSFQLAARGGITVRQFSPFTSGIEAGLISRARGGRVAVVVEPGLYVGISGRSSDDEAPEAIPAKEILDIPVSLQLQAQPQTALFLTTGLRESLRDFGDSYEIPLGFGTTVALNHRLDLGAEFLFEDLFGENGGAERRVLFLRAALRV